MGFISKAASFFWSTVCKAKKREAQASVGLSRGLLRFMLAVQLYGPFLRSMVKCAAKLQPGAFTGSAHCGDSNLVLFVAQAREGWMHVVVFVVLEHLFASVC